MKAIAQRSVFDGMAATITEPATRRRSNTDRDAEQRIRSTL